MKLERNLVGDAIITGVPAIVTSLNQEVLNLNNEKLTEYQMGSVTIIYPDGTEQPNVATRFYKKVVDLYPETYRKGEKITISMQVEGEYKGRCVAEIVGNSIADVDKLVLMLGEQLETKDKVIADELVM